MIPHPETYYRFRIHSSPL